MTALRHTGLPSAVRLGIQHCAQRFCQGWPYLLRDNGRESLESHPRLSPLGDPTDLPLDPDVAQIAGSTTCPVPGFRAASMTIWWLLRRTAKSLRPVDFRTTGRCFDWGKLSCEVTLRRIVICRTMISSRLYVNIQLAAGATPIVSSHSVRVSPPLDPAASPFYSGLRCAA